MPGWRSEVRDDQFYNKNMDGLSRELIIHPSETLKEILKDQKMSLKELALRTGVTEARVSNVVNCQKMSQFGMLKNWNMPSALMLVFGLTCKAIMIKRSCKKAQ